MKFSLAVALSHHAELLIMDEPTSGLDPLVRSEAPRRAANIAAGREQVDFLFDAYYL